MAIRRSVGEKIFDNLNVLLMLGVIVVTLYPFLYVIFASLSLPGQLLKFQGILLMPQGFTLKAYELVLKNPSIYTGYGNTLFYVCVGSALNVFMTSLGAYVLSRKGVMLRNFFMMLIVFTMYFGGGLIPSYLLVRDLGLDNTRWSLIIPGLIGTWNLIVMTNAFKAIPESLEESARIDGANDIIILFKVIIPLSLPVVMVMVLYYGVGHWNSWFGAMIYLRKRALYPLQLFLREILIQESMKEMHAGSEFMNENDISLNVKYATIIVSTLPILFAYPFLQKYFVKGIMVGALKG